MTTLSAEEDALTQWLRQRLSDERELLEMRHAALLQEFQANRMQRAQHCDPHPAVELDVKLEDVKLQGIIKEIDSATSAGMDIRNDSDPLKAEDCISEVQDDRSSWLADEKVSPQSEKIGRRASQIGTGVGNWIRTRKTPNTRLGRLVTSRRFELFFALVIFLNMMEMALSMQYHGFANGYSVGYPGYFKPKEEVWPAMDRALQVTNWVFGIIYTVELVLKIIGLRAAFLELWNIFDFCIVLVFYIENFAFKVRIPIDAMLLRLFRLFKVLRLLRLVHEVAGLAQLLLMVTALKGSLQMLAWATMLLLGMQTVFAFVLNQLLSETVIENDKYDMEIRQECFQYFGTFSRAIFSMFELTLANWIPISRFLIEDISAFFVLFAIVYKLTLGFAVVGVVNACFIKETFKIVATDRTMMIIEKEREKAAFAREMTRFMEHADSDGGTLDLSYSDFQRVCHDEHVKHWLGAQGLDASDAKLLFELMDDGSGALDPQELIKGVGKLKGHATSLNLAVMHRDGQDMHRRIAHLERKLHHIKEAWNTSTNKPLKMSL